MQESIFCKKPVINLPANTKRRKPILRKLLFCFIFLLLQTSPKTYGQKISLSLKNAPLERVFEEIGRQSGNIIWYSNEVISEDKHITVYIDNVPVEEALTVVLSGQPLYFVKNGSFFVIRPNESAQSLAHTEVAENAKHKSILLQIFIAVIVSFAVNFPVRFFKRVFNKKNKFSEQKNYRVYTNEKNEGLKVRPEVFNALISVAKAENISEETRKKIIDLLVYDYHEALRRDKCDNAHSKSATAEVEAGIESGIKAHHVFEMSETISEGL
jgi:hypothetical protein